MMWKKLRRRGRRCCSRRDYGGDEDCDDNLKLKNLTKLDVSVRDVYKLAKVNNEYGSRNEIISSFLIVVGFPIDRPDPL